jgi:hypothetical protein
MRRGGEAGGEKMGGAWQWAAMLRAKESRSRDSQDAAITANTTGENDALCTDEGCTKGACIVGMVLQQFWPWWPCDEQCIELQHCIACSGVVMPPQSDAYAATAKVSTARRTCLAKPILSRLEGFGARVKVSLGAVVGLS